MVPKLLNVAWLARTSAAAKKTTRSVGRLSRFKEGLSSLRDPDDVGGRMKDATTSEAVAAMNAPNTASGPDEASTKPPTTLAAAKLIDPQRRIRPKSRAMPWRINVSTDASTIGGMDWDRTIMAAEMMKTGQKP